MSPGKSKKASDPKKDAPDPQNKITGVRLEPELRAALDRIAAKMNVLSPYATVTPAGLIRGLVKKFVIEQGEMDKPSKPRGL